MCYYLNVHFRGQRVKGRHSTCTKPVTVVLIWMTLKALTNFGNIDPVTYIMKIFMNGAMDRNVHAVGAGGWWKKCTHSRMLWMSNCALILSPCIYTGCNRRNGPDFGRVFLRSYYTDITQNTYIQSSMVTEILAREVWNLDSYYSLIDYQIHIETGRNMWFL